ncbi:hypothetical protein KY362_02885 [Candidatus Woesearchaeota archaeon]|nr:hypothetical protein [Candidatus Woesearchaeota archaeon]
MKQGIEWVVGAVRETNYSWEHRTPLSYMIELTDGNFQLGMGSVPHNDSYPKLIEGDVLEVLVYRSKTGLRQIFGTRLTPADCPKPAYERVYSDYAQQMQDDTEKLVRRVGGDDVLEDLLVRLYEEEPPKETFLRKDPDVDIA